MQINLTDFNQLQEEGYLTSFIHPSYPELIGWNYSQTCQFEKHWVPATLISRGLVTDQKGNVIARPFQKFFNLDEHPNQSELLGKQISTITEKEDGSLIILFHYDNKWQTMTRGSFGSEQALMAKELLKGKDLLLHQQYTYCFELVGPDNRHVCNKHNELKLILLGAIDKETGHELTREQLITCSFLNDFELVKIYEWNSLELKNRIESLVSTSDPNVEGVVIQFHDGTRVKIKTELYKKLHRVMTRVLTPKRIIDLWITDNFKQNLEDIPDEFFSDITISLRAVDKQYFDHRTNIILLWDRAVQMIKEGATRKTLAISYPELRPYLTDLFQGSTFPEEVCKSVFIKQFLKE